MNNTPLDKAVGGCLERKLAERDVSLLQVEVLIELLIQTKRPQMFSEDDVRGDGSDRNQQDLSNLGDTNIVPPVTLFDDGKHAHSTAHNNPIETTLLFAPGAFFRRLREYSGPTGYTVNYG